jgi:acylphosphatase
MKGEQMIKRFHVQVFGRVQMVGFRFFTETVARLLHLTGTVENKDKDQVEIFVEGPEADLSTFLRLIHYGPSHARVDECVAGEETPQGDADFHAIYPPVELNPDCCPWCGEELTDVTFHVADPVTKKDTEICVFCYVMTGAV